MEGCISRTEDGCGRIAGDNEPLHLKIRAQKKPSGDTGGLSNNLITNNYMYARWFLPSIQLAKARLTTLLPPGVG